MNDNYLKKENRILKLFLIEALHELGRAISIDKISIEDSEEPKGIEFKEHTMDYKLIAYPISRK